MKRLVVALAAAAALAAPAFAALKEGVAAPDFSAKGMLGGKEFTFKLSDALKKGPVVVYFFPAAYTPWCTAETKMFADAADAYKEAGATLIGVTGVARMADGSMANASQSLKRLAEFSAEHCRDKFPIAAVDNATISKYEVLLPDETVKSYEMTLPGDTKISDRTSYVIGKDGKIALTYSAEKPDEHVAKTLAAVRGMQGAHAAHAHH